MNKKKWIRILLFIGYLLIFPLAGAIYAYAYGTEPTYWELLIAFTFAIVVFILVRGLHDK